MKADLHARLEDLLRDYDPEEIYDGLEDLIRRAKGQGPITNIFADEEANKRLGKDKQ